MNQEIIGPMMKQNIVTKCSNAKNFQGDFFNCKPRTMYEEKIYTHIYKCMCVCVHDLI